MKFSKKERKCEKCNRIISPDEEIYYGLCFECYKEYLIDQIHQIGKPQPPKEAFSFKKLPQKFLMHIKKFFNDF